MQRIRNRSRLDTLVNQSRVGSPVAWGKRIYLALVTVLGLLVLNYAVGDAIILRADGTVLNDRYIVAATYPAKVLRVNVREGQKVQAGQELVELESSEMLKEISELSILASELAIREAQLRNRRSTVTSLLPLAERHASESNTQISRLDAIKARGLVSAQRMDQALSSEYVAASQLTELRAQSGALDDELSLVERSRERAAAALAQLESFYDKGTMRATAEGTVGARVPVAGQVVKVGDELLQVNSGKAYIIAYMPDMYLFEVKSGDKISIGGGSHLVAGEVETILTVADALPAEFQNMFRPRDRGRLIRVKLPDDHGFAVSQKIHVGGCIAGWCGF